MRSVPTSPRSTTSGRAQKAWKCMPWRSLITQANMRQVGSFSFKLPDCDSVIEIASMPLYSWVTNPKMKYTLEKIWSTKLSFTFLSKCKLIPVNCLQASLNFATQLVFMEMKFWVESFFCCWCSSCAKNIKMKTQEYAAWWMEWGFTWFPRWTLMRMSWPMRWYIELS